MFPVVAHFTGHPETLFSNFISQLICISVKLTILCSYVRNAWIPMKTKYQKVSYGPISNPVVTKATTTVYPKKYAHGFVVLCFVVVMQSFISNSHEVFIHIHQGCFAGTGAIVRLPQCQWSKPDEYGKISQCITTTKHSKAKTVCIFLGIYCKKHINGGSKPIFETEMTFNKTRGIIGYLFSYELTPSPTPLFTMKVGECQ